MEVVEGNVPLPNSALVEVEQVSVAQIPTVKQSSAELSSDSQRLDQNLVNVGDSQTITAVENQTIMGDSTVAQDSPKPVTYQQPEEFGKSYGGQQQPITSIETPILKSRQSLFVRPKPLNQMNKPRIIPMPLQTPYVSPPKVVPKEKELDSKMAEFSESIQKLGVIVGNTESATPDINIPPNKTILPKESVSKSDETIAVAVVPLVEISKPTPAALVVSDQQESAPIRGLPAPVSNVCVSDVPKVEQPRNEPKAIFSSPITVAKVVVEKKPEPFSANDESLDGSDSRQDNPQIAITATSLPLVLVEPLQVVSQQQPPTVPLTQSTPLRKAFDFDMPVSSQETAMEIISNRRHLRHFEPDEVQTATSSFLSKIAAIPLQTNQPMSAVDDQIWPITQELPTHYTDNAHVYHEAVYTIASDIDDYDDSGAEDEVDEQPPASPSPFGGEFDNLGAASSTFFNDIVHESTCRVEGKKNLPAIVELEWDKLPVVVEMGQWIAQSDQDLSLLEDGRSFYLDHNGSDTSLGEFERHQLAQYEAIVADYKQKSKEVFRRFVAVTSEKKVRLTEALSSGYVYCEQFLMAFGALCKMVRNLKEMSLLNDRQVFSSILGIQAKIATRLVSIVRSAVESACDEHSIAGGWVAFRPDIISLLIDMFNHGGIDLEK